MEQLVHGCGELLGNAFLIVIYVFVLLTNRDNSGSVDPFKAITMQAQTACSIGWGKEPTSTVPYRIGKILVVDAWGDVTDYLKADKVAANVVASSPEEVGTLICVGSSKELYLGKPSSRLPAYQLLRDVILVNLATGDVIYKATLKGSIPPTSADPQGGSYYGTDPEFEQLREFILALPEK